MSIEGSAAATKRTFSLALWFLAFALTFATDPAFGNSFEWPTLGFTQIVTNIFARPTSITHAGDGSQRIFVEEQNGRIWIIQSNTVPAQPFLDITNRVLSAGFEQGLLGLAFPPGYSTNGHFYVDYTRQTDGAVVVSRFQLSTNSNVADTNSEQIVMVIPKSFDNHNGGQLAFGPDGYLYIGVGDGGSEGDPQNIGQNTGTLLGKLLRIDVESGASPYAIPTNNPFMGNTNYAPEIWALGLRNPWRFSFDRITGDLFIGDVGQGQFEEIDFQPAGAIGGQNYGWRIMEGPTNYIVPPGFTNFSALTLPVAWYDHRTGGIGAAAVIGGYVYRGPSQPRMDGVYFYGDFELGWLWGLKQTGTNWQSLALVTPAFSGPHFLISSFGEDEQGRIYLAEHGQGIIYQIQDTHQVWTPTFSPANGTINSNVVMVTCFTTNAEIHYTTNGIDPTLSDPIVASGGFIQVNTGITNKARAYRADLNPSSIGRAVYTNKVAAPVFSPPQGAVTNGTLVSITTITPGATIYYTTNGAPTTNGSLLYTGPIVINRNIRIFAIGTANGYTSSAFVAANYSLAQVATPVFNPPFGPITNGTSISISCSTPGSTIYYTLDGTTPTTNSAVYSVPLIINGGTTVKAFAVASAYLNSVVQSVLYSLPQTATPVFSPPNGPITNGTRIAISCSTPGSTIYFTLDGGTPTTNSPAYSGPVAINGGTTVSAYAISDQHLDSPIQSIFYQLVQTATPVFSAVSGPVPYGTNVSISCSTPGAAIYYTLDGSSPTTNSTSYSGPLTITGDVTLNALAVTPEHFDSVIQSMFYTIEKTATPTFTPSQGPLTVGETISITCMTSNATIRYTLDGSDPDTNAAIYSVPISFTKSFTLNARAYAPQHDPSDIVSVFYGILSLENTVVTTYAGGPTAGFSNGVGTLATFSGPRAICIDRFSNLFVADPGNSVIRKISSSGQVTTYAGSGIYGLLDGQATNAQFSSPVGVCIDALGNVYVSNGQCNRVRKIDTGGTVTTLAEIQGCGYGASIWQMEADPAGNVYVGQYGSVFTVSPNGALFDLASLEYWQWGVGIGLDASTNVYASVKYRIAKVAPNGSVELFAGSNGSAGFADGPRLLSLFQGPQDTAVDTVTNIFVSDISRIRRIRPNGWVSTLAGTGISGYQNGRGSVAQFNATTGLCLDTNGNIYVADSGNNCIRKISPDTAGIGIADDWQIAHFGHVGIDPNADPDHDGMNNYQEFWAGTDPLDPKSVLIINSVSVVTNGLTQITWQSVPGKSYAVKYSSDFNIWNTLTNPVQGSSSNLSVVDPTPVAQVPQRFYRVFVNF